MGSSSRSLLGLALVALACSAAAEGESGRAEAALSPDGDPDWQRRIAVGDSVSSSGVATDADGNAFVSGHRLAGVPADQRSSSAAFVAKYSAAGDLLWAQLLDSPDSDAAAGVSTDADGAVLVAGDTSGSLAGDAAGWGDAFLAKYTPAGELDWARQLGTTEPDAAAALSPDPSGAVFVAGYTRGALQAERSSHDADAFVARYSSAGELLWITQLGSSPGYEEFATGVSAAAGEVYVAGYTFGALQGDSQGSADAFVAKLSGQGEVLWIRQQGGAGHDAAAALRVADDGNVVVAGQADGVLAGGPGVVIPGHPCVAKYSPLGELLWEQQLEAGATGAATSLSSDDAGRLQVAGYTSAAWGGPRRGLYDSFVATLSAEGELLSVQQLGVQELDRATGVSTSGEHVLLTRDVRSWDPKGSDAAFLVRQTSAAP
jgi:hypothetical protein